MASLVKQTRAGNASASTPTSYNIYRSTSSGTQNYATPIANTTGIVSYAGGSTLMWTDSGLSNGSEYFYTVKALNGCAESEASDESSDIVDPEAIPWDTRDPGQILAAASLVAEESAPDEPIDIEGGFTVMGPDGAAYARGNPNQQPPSGTFDEVTGEYILNDGTSIALPRDMEEDVGSSEFSIRPLDVGRNLFGGAYRGVLSKPGYRRCSFDVILSTDFNLRPGREKGYNDTCWTYLGSSAPNVGIDAGLQYNGQKDNYWHLNMRVSSPKQALWSGKIQFTTGSRVRLSYWVQLKNRPGTKSKKRLIFIKAQDTSGTFDEDTICAPVINHHDGTKIKMKRVQQLAQSFKTSDERNTGYAMTGSWMRGFTWQSGRIWPSDGASKSWALGDTEAATSFRPSVVAATELARYHYETPVNIDLR